MELNQILFKEEGVRYFIFDSGKSEGDINFEQYVWRRNKYNKVRSGDWFLYKCSRRVSKSNQFYFFGIGKVGDISKFKDDKVKCKVLEPIRFTNLVYQNDLNDYKWVFKPRGKDYQRFFNQYGMTEIVFKDLHSITIKGVGNQFDTDENHQLVESHKRYHSDNDNSSEDKYSLGKYRGYDQKIFSDDVKDSYNNKCCITGINTRSMLEGSHIVSWSKDKTIRKDPRNGLCLSVLIHKCFDKGFVIIDDDYLIKISDKVKGDKKLWNYLEPFNNTKIKLPVKKENYPNIEYLRKHREYFIDNF